MFQIDGNVISFVMVCFDTDERFSYQRADFPAKGS